MIKPPKWVNPVIDFSLGFLLAILICGAVEKTTGVLLVLIFALSLLFACKILDRILDHETEEDEFNEVLKAIEEHNEDGEKKCSFPDGIDIRPDGIHSLDPCIYETIETHENVTVEVLKCRKCGHVELDWYKSEEE